MAFPTALTNAVDDVTEIVAAHLNNLEAKVGIDGSAVVTSLDYLLKNAASINPGHKHSKLWASDGSPEAVTVDAAGHVGIGTISPSSLLHLIGGGLTVGATRTDQNEYAGNGQIFAGLGGGNGTPGSIISVARLINGATSHTAGTGAALEFAIGGNYNIATVRARIDGLDPAGNGTGQLDFYTTDASYNLTHRMTIKNDGKVGIGTPSPTSPLQVVGLPAYANNAAAVAAGLTAGAFYRTGGDPDTVCVVH